MTFWVAGAAVVGAGIGAVASNRSAKTQAGASDRATEAEREMFDKQVALQEPWRQGGGLGLNALLYGAGLSPTGTFTPGAAPTMLQPGADGVFAPAAAPATAAPAPPIQWGAPIDVNGPTTMRDQYNAYVQRGGRLPAESWAEAWTAGTLGANEKGGPPNAPNVGYGDLLRPFGMQDFQVDPGYTFRQSEGEKGLQRMRASSGSLGSGAFVKDALRFNQGLATDEYGRAYDRYRLNQGDTFNRLAALAGIGQTATNQTTQAAGQFGSQIGGNIIGAGNAQAAGQVGVANALTGGIGQGLSLYQNNRLLNDLQAYRPTMPPNPYFGGTPAGYNYGGV